MVELSKVRSSNKQIAATLPSGLIAVFVGATSGIGELAMRAFVQHSVQPRVYMIGRSKEASDRIVTDLKTINPQGRYTFIQADVSLITAVDKVCEQIRANETAINLLFQSQGSLNTGSSETFYSISSGNTF
jgi:NADP-dependent 3-hydroxy acid dehydrogenase YdfG